MLKKIGKVDKSSFQSRLGRFIAHRGASGYAPENTRAALLSAHSHGATWVEVDAQVTTDGEVIIFHDATLDRTTNGSGMVTKSADSAIRSLDAGSWFAKEFTGEAIPTLSQAISLCCRLKMGMNIEIKAGANVKATTGAVVARVVADSWPRNQPPPLLSSFSDCFLEAARNVYPSAAQGIICSRIPEECILDKVANRYELINADVKFLTKNDVIRVKSKGIILTAYTVNNSTEARRLFDWGVDTIYTDYPSQFFFSASLPVN